jgi:ribosomal protein S16
VLTSSRPGAESKLRDNPKTLVEVAESLGTSIPSKKEVAHTLNVTNTEGSVDGIEEIGLDKPLSKSKRRQLRRQRVHQQKQGAGIPDEFKAHRLITRSKQLQKQAIRTFKVGIELAKQASAAGSIPDPSSSTVIIPPKPSCSSWLFGDQPTIDDHSPSTSIRSESRATILSSKRKLSAAINILDESHRIIHSTIPSRESKKESENKVLIRNKIFKK